MTIAILEDCAAFSDYLGELLSTWGMPDWHAVKADAIAGLDPKQTPILLLPVGNDLAAAVDYARRGGIVVAQMPLGSVAEAAGLKWEGEKATPLRLRLVSEPLAGLAGELLPIVGDVANYERTADDVRALAYLTLPQQYHGESVGITERPIGDGTVIAFAFNLPYTLMLLRQGDPAKADIIPQGDRVQRASHLMCDLGGNDAGWLPFADLLGRLFVDLLQRRAPLPLPLFDHLPNGAPGVVLYSGDEDRAPVADNDTEFAAVTAADGRMNLYIIPENTNSSPEDAQRYLAHHDLGPHVDLVPHAGKSIDERLAEFERQVKAFQEIFDVVPLTARNHNLMWVGYSELAELQATLGIRMDANFLCGATYLRDFDTAPYAGYGAAMPMRFCRQDGSLIEIYQQHFHVEDDCHYSDHIAYSTKFTEAMYEANAERCLDNIARRFQVPYGANLHPSNWTSFSAPQGETLLRRAAEFGMPVWSFDQWCTFWQARGTWRAEAVQWDGATLSFQVHGEALPGLCLDLPASFGDVALQDVTVDGAAVEQTKVLRFGVTCVQVPAPETAATIAATYG